MAQTEIVILPNNKYAQVTLEDEDVLKKLDRLLSYKEPGIEFSPQFQRFGWNGVNHLLNKKGKFPIGLLDMTQKFLTENQITFEVVDRRPVVENAEPMDISKRLIELKKVPRYYQINAVKAALNHRQGIIKSCTGSGKTLISAIIVAALNKPTNIFVVGLDLLQQFHDLFSEIFQEEIGYVGNGVCEIRRINIVSLWTAAKSLSPKKKIKVSDDDDEKEKFNESDAGKIQTMIKSAKVIVFDECHGASTDSFKKIYSSINPEYIYGMSGTPHKLEETDLLIKALLGDIIVDIPASELIDKGFLIKPVIKFFEVPKEYVESRTYLGIYKEYIVENTTRNRMIVTSTKKLVENGFQTLVLFRQITHGKKLLEMLRKEGVEVEMLSGKDKLERREEIKARLLSGELRCVISSSIYDTGVDISSLNALVLASPNKSLVRALQRIGRVIRIHPGKTEVRVVDFWDNTLFLKNHSKRRYHIYCQEKGFEVHIPKGIKI
jgi:superfamily II DNA or RNA helicase